jgi:cold-inducible RNA-binding protein
MSKKLFVGNLDYVVTDEDLMELFKQYGAVESAQVIKDRDTGRSRGFGFVEMTKGEDAESAINAVNGQEMNGRALTVNEAQSKERSGGPGRNRRIA